MKNFSIDKVEFQVIWHEEHTPIRGNVFDSGDAEQDRKDEAELIEQFEYNEWAWCTIEVKAYYKGLEASDYLGGCSYESKEDFINNSGYYEDMKARTFEEIQEQLKALILEHC